jgi:chemotaxis signal transduction protein
VDLAEAEIQAVPDFGAQVDVGFVSGLARVGERLLVLLDVGKVLDGDVRVGEGPPVTG